MVSPWVLRLTPRFYFILFKSWSSEVQTLTLNLTLRISVTSLDLRFLMCKMGYDDKVRCGIKLVNHKELRIRLAT